MKRGKKFRILRKRSVWSKRDAVQTKRDNEREPLRVMPHRASWGGSAVKSPPAMQGHKHSLEKEVAAHASIPARRIPWTRSLAGYSPWSLESQTRLSKEATATQGGRAQCTRCRPGPLGRNHLRVPNARQGKRAYILAFQNKKMLPNRKVN